jgi:heme/copper-type cytochrome/quinol oxidase subunit 1
MGDHHHGPAKGISVTTNHKDIGTMYLMFALVMFFMWRRDGHGHPGRTVQPGLQVVDPQFFNSMTTMHALLMIFGAVMPAFTGLANWMIPMMIGAPDMALPRMNNFSLLDPAVRLHAAAVDLLHGRAVDRPAAGPCTRRCRCRWAMASRS